MTANGARRNGTANGYDSVPTQRSNYKKSLIQQPNLFSTCRPFFRTTKQQVFDTQNTPTHSGAEQRRLLMRLTTKANAYNCATV